MKKNQKKSLLLKNHKIINNTIMKKFNEIRESQKAVFNKKLMGVPVKISSIKSKGKTSFSLYIDGNKLDDYKSEKEAMMTAKEFVKQYRKSK